MLLRPAWRLSHIERETEEGRRRGGAEGGVVLGHNASASQCCTNKHCMDNGHGRGINRFYKKDTGTKQLTKKGLGRGFDDLM